MAIYEISEDIVKIIDLGFELNWFVDWITLNNVNTYIHQTVDGWCIKIDTAVIKLFIKLDDDFFKNGIISETEYEKKYKFLQNNLMEILRKFIKVPNYIEINIHNELPF